MTVVVGFSDVDKFLAELETEVHDVEDKVVRVDVFQEEVNQTAVRIHLRSGFLCRSCLRDLVMLAGTDYSPLQEGTDAAKEVIHKITDRCMSLGLAVREGCFEIVGDNAE